MGDAVWRTLGADEWEARYRSGTTPWDLPRPPPALLRTIERAGPAPLRVLVPGAGFGTDAIAWARAGHRVTAVDFAPSAVAGARERTRLAGAEVRVVEADLFALPDEHDAAYDLVWEQTCFCAVLPERRDDYARAVADALVPGGRLVGLFWNHGRPGGPPYDLDPGLVRATLAERFLEESFERVPDSAGDRSNEFVLWVRRRDMPVPT